MVVNSMKNVIKHIKMKFLISPLKCFLCQVIILKLVYRKINYQPSIIFTKKIDLIRIYGIWKSATFCLQSNSLRCIFFNSTSIIWLINKIMLDVLYRSRECLDQPEFYHMEFLTYVLQNIATNKLMFSGRNTNDPVWLRNENLNFWKYFLMCCF